MEYFIEYLGENICCDGAFYPTGRSEILPEAGI